MDTGAYGNSHLLPVGTLIGNGKYRLDSCLGEGGFGITYLGTDVRLNRKVAVKEFYVSQGCFRQLGDPNVYVLDNPLGNMFYRLRDEFVKEAQILAKLDEQPGVVRVITYEEENQTAYIVMDYVEGDSLGSYVVKRGNILSVQATLDIMRPVIQALAGIHQKQVVHRDISPDNIMITKDNRVKLIDFGAARTSGEYNDSKVSKGGYTPIEQKTRDGEVGTYTDIYALCATIYKCITGHSVPDSRLRATEQYDPCVPPSALGIQITPKQEQALMTGLAVWPQNRTQNAAELYYQLYVDQTNMITSAPVPTTSAMEASYLIKRIELEQKRDKKRTVALGIIGALALLFIFAFIGVLSRQNEANSNNTTGQAIEEPVENQEHPTVELEPVDLDAYKDKLMEEILSSRPSDAPSLTKDANLEAAADYCSTYAAGLTYTDTNDLNSQLAQLGQDTVETFKIPSVSWVITGLNLEYEVDQVKQTIDGQIAANNEAQGGIYDLSNCTRIGIGLSRAKDGMFYWTIIFN